MANRIYPFIYQPPLKGQEDLEPFVVFAINHPNPEKHWEGSWLQGYWACTHCGAGHIYRFYDEAPYEARCPSCNKDFLADEPEWAEEEDEYDARKQ
jgi:hypothetical protein